MTLSTALALFGLLVLALMALQLWWSSKRKQRELQLVQPRSEDRVEPAMGGGAGGLGDMGDMGNRPSDGQTDVDISLADPAEDAEGADHNTALPGAPRKTVPRLDALIDAIVSLAVEAPISGEAALAHLPPTHRAGSKPFYIEGLDAETGTWEVLAHGRRYSELQAGVQLANRSGALNEIEYSEFMQKVQAYADAVGASIDGAGAPDMLEVVARARELDSLAAPLDAQLTVTLRTNGVAWSVSFVQQVAARIGFVPGVLPGRMVLPSPEVGEPPMLVLAVDAQAALAEEPQSSVIRECTLALDVPQTSAVREPFPAWHLAARKLADDLDATLGDDQGQTISLQAFSEIGQELDGLYMRLEALGLPAGSAAARRVFG